MPEREMDPYEKYMPRRLITLDRKRLDLVRTEEERPLTPIETQMYSAVCQMIADYEDRISTFDEEMMKREDE